MIANINIISLIFFITSAVYTFIGFYSFSLNKENRINQLFFVICLCLAEWAVCFSLSISTDPSNIEKARIFRQISVLGWGIFYSLGYHFLNLLMHPDKKISIYRYALIYIPSLLNIIFYTCLGEISNAQFAMLYTQHGWISENVSSPLNLYFTLYAFIFSTITILKAVRWQCSSNNSKVTTESRLLTILYLITFIASLTIEVILNKIFGHNILQITIIFLALPVSVMFYILLKKKVILPKIETNTYQIIDEQKQENIFNMTGFVYLVFAYTSLFFNYFIEAHRLPNQIIYSGLIYITGTVHFFLKRCLKNKSTQYQFITVIAVILMLVISIRYRVHGFSIVLSFFFFYLMLTAVFEKNRYTYLIVSGIIMVQIYSWYYYPRISNLTIDNSEYSRRIIAIIVGLFVVLYINKLYKTKIKENLEQIDIQNTLSLISNDLLEVNIDNLNDKIADILKLCKEYFNYSSAYYYQVQNDTKTLKQIYCTNGPIDEEITKVYDSLPQKQLILARQKCPVLNLDNEDMSDAAKEYFKSKNIIGFYEFPVIVEGVVEGCVVFEFTKHRKNTAMCDFNQIISNLISNTIKKVNYEKILYYNANYDVLTRLKNRNGFTKEVNKLIEEKDLKKPAVIFLDIDNFKIVNNAFGYSVGDELLKTVAKILKENSTDESIIARFNKDEFSLFYPYTKDKAEIAERIQKILELFEKPIHVAEYEFKIYINIGISVFPEDGKSSEDLLKNADLALNEVKKINKVRYHFCDEKDKNKTLESAVYTNKLFTALQNNELKLAYQPQVDCKTGKIIGAEALIRWESPEFGTVSPGKFIPILEHTGMIIRIGEWIIEQVAMQQVKMSVKGLPKIRLSVNLSVIQFQDEKLIDKLRQILENWVIDTDYFELEITENVAVSNNDFLLERFEEIKEMGCSIAIDDFGVEFSSLNRLQSLPIDRLKIDKTFVDGIGIDEKRESIIKIIIQLAEALKLESIAEGVETEEQLKFLQDNNCKEIQGYYFAKPMYQEEFEEFVRNNI